MGNKLKTIDKIAQIISLSYSYLQNCNILDVPGLQEIGVSTTEWNEIKIASCEYDEKQEETGYAWEQNLTAVVAGLSIDKQIEFEKIAGTPLILRLDYSNNKSKIVGNKEYPVYLSVGNAGTPHAVLITFKRKSAESSKFLKSF